MTSLPARLLLGPIRVYQRYISPGLPANCRYYPTCSAYAVEALQEWGALRGSWLALRRLGRCQPWSRREHFDPVPIREPRRRAKSFPADASASPASQSFQDVHRASPSTEHGSRLA